MDASQSLTELVTTAQSNAAISQDLIAALRGDSTGQNVDAERSAATDIGATAIDIFAVFEARMQGYFKRGPLSRKVKAALLEVGQADLADKLHQHYLMINVLKHGTGASYRELLGNKSNLFSVYPSDAESTETAPHISLVDVTRPGFFDGLAETILAAASFLENRSAY